MAMEQRVDRVEQRQDRLEDIVATMGELLIETREMVVEMRRENRQTRRIWIAIARKQELFDDDEFRDVLNRGTNSSSPLPLRYVEAEATGGREGSRSVNSPPRSIPAINDLGILAPHPIVIIRPRILVLLKKRVHVFGELIKSGAAVLVPLPRADVHVVHVVLVQKRARLLEVRASGISSPHHDPARRTHSKVRATATRVPASCR